MLSYKLNTFILRLLGSCTHVDSEAKIENGKNQPRTVRERHWKGAAARLAGTWKIPPALRGARRTAVLHIEQHAACSAGSSGQCHDCQQHRTYIYKGSGPVNTHIS